MKTRLFVLLFVFVSFLDAYFTISILSNENYFAKVNTQEYVGYEESLEMNPVSRSVLIKYGAEGMVLYKTSMIAIVCIALTFTHKKYPRLSFCLAVSAFILTAIVAALGLAFLVLYHASMII